MSTSSTSVMVTGAAGGVAAEISRRLAADGAEVAVLDREPPRSLVAEIEAAGGSALAVGADVRRPDEVERAVAEAEAAFGWLDGLVTAAGVQRVAPSTEVGASDWDLVLDVNLTGTWRCVQAVLGGMLERGIGRIVTISSEIALAGAPRYSAYAASKGGVVALTKSLAQEYAGEGLFVNSVAPGPIEAGMLLGEDAYTPDWLARNVPLKRWGTPADVAATVSFLLSGEADFFVGQVLSPNGGVVI